MEYLHVYSRGIDKTNIFRDKNDAIRFKKKYDYYLNSMVITHAWCYLYNHFHLVISLKEGFSWNPAASSGTSVYRKFSHWLNSHAQYFNQRHHRTGSLFVRPLKKKAITDEKYFTHLICYVHWNPQLHRLTDDFRTWSFSSYNQFLSEVKPDVSSVVMQEFGGLENFVIAHSEIRDRVPERLKIE